ncbi:MAG: N-methyl-L-tryptophan oxidase [Janthinobacterium lividum]
MENSYDVIVLGLGAMGSAATYQLGRKGVRVLGIDQFSPPHTHGSSHGDTRVTRQAIGEGEAYTPLALRSNEIWREIEKQTDQELYVATGGLIIGDPSSASTLHGKTNFLQTTLAAAEKYRIPHEILAPEEIRRRFPPFQVRDNEVGYYEPGAGFLRPERCVETQLKLAQASSAEIHSNEKVLGFEPAGNRIRVRTDQSEYEAEKLIISAGPWAAELLGSEMKPLFPVYRQVLYWFDVEARYSEFTPDCFPIFIWSLETEGDGIYGFPALDSGSGGIKVAAEQYLVTTTPESVDRTVTLEETRDMYSRRIQPYLDGVTGQCLRSVSCLYTVTPDYNFIIDFHPDMPQVVIASPCSGHGFKHSAAIGEALAELVTEGKSRVDVSSFSLRRFAAGG